MLKLTLRDFAMLDKLSPFFIQRNKKYLYEWNKALTDSKNVIKYKMERFEELEFTLNDVTRRLKNCILAIDIKNIKNYTSPVEAFLSYIEPMRFKIEAFWNSAFPLTNNGPWVKSASTYEILVPVQSTDPLVRLPQTLKWENESSNSNTWKNIRPVRVHYYDSIELSYDIVRKFNYSIFKPSVFIFTVDINKFILKYLSYAQHINDYSNLETLIDRYVYKYLYLPVIEDLLEIWVFNIIENCIRSESVIEDQILLNSQTNSLTPPSLKTGIKALLSYRDDLLTKTMMFEDFIATDFFHNKNLPELIDTYYKEYRTYRFIQYRHYQFLLELPYIRLIHTVLKKQRDVSKKPIDIQFERGIINYFNDNIGSRYKNSFVRNYVENILFTMRT